jgi:hypothetical protein
MSSGGLLDLAASEQGAALTNGHHQGHNVSADPHSQAEMASEQAEFDNMALVNGKNADVDADRTAHIEQQASPAAAAAQASPPSALMRTVAIIKHHALEDRFNIESRITEAGFEVSAFSVVRVKAHHLLSFILSQCRECTDVYPRS